MACLLLGPKRSGKTSVLLSCACSIAVATSHETGTSALPKELDAAGKVAAGGTGGPQGTTSQPPSVVFICNRAKMESSPPYIPPANLSPMLSRIQFHYVESYKDVLQLCAALHLSAAAGPSLELSKADAGLLATGISQPGGVGPARDLESLHAEAARDELQGCPLSSAAASQRGPLPCALLVDDFLALFDTRDRGTQRRAHRADAGELEGQVFRTAALLVDTARFLTDRMKAAGGGAVQSGATEPTGAAEAWRQDGGHAPASSNGQHEATGACSIGKRCVLFLAVEASDLASSALSSHVDAGAEPYRRCSAVLQRWVPSMLRISPTPTPGCFQACGHVKDSRRWQWPPATDAASEQDQDRSWHPDAAAPRCPRWSIFEDMGLLPGSPCAPDPFVDGVGEFVHATSCRHGTNRVIKFSYCIPC